MNRQLLEQPFDSKYIKQRKGRNNMMLDYLETHIVIQRLNDSFDGNWSFEIIEYQQMADEVIVLGKLTAEGVTKMQFGSATIVKARGTDEIISIGDDLKSAASDCLKKCATLFGVGLHLYGELPDGISEGDGSENTKTDMVNITSNQGTNLITKEQLAQIKKLRTELKLTPEDVQAKCKRLFGTNDVTAINSTMANALIAYLQNNGGSANK